MIIKRELKNATWEYDEEKQLLRLTRKQEVEGMPDGLPDVITEEITLNRTYAFSLARFLIRVFFRMSMKKRPQRKVIDQQAHDEIEES